MNLHRFDTFKSLANEPGINDVALLIVRVALAWIFIYHGAETLFGAFHGPGIHGEALFFANVAQLHPATFFAVLGGIIEFFGGIAVGIGLVGRLAALCLFGDMIMAIITVTSKNGLVSGLPGGGYELNLALAGLAAVIVLQGTGRWSVIRVLRDARKLRTRRRKNSLGTPRPNESPTSEER